MQVVMDSSRYLYMTISTIKLHDLSGYEEITTCKSCSYGIRNIHAINYNPNNQAVWSVSYEKITTYKLCSYRDLKYLGHQLQLQ